MRAVRYLLRVSMLVLVGIAVFCGLVLLFNAQALLNRYAELYMMDTERSSTVGDEPSQRGTPRTCSPSVSLSSCSNTASHMANTFFASGVPITSSRRSIRSATFA